VLRRSLLVVLAATLALMLVPAALAATVHVRVEGKAQTIWGGNEPLVVAGNALQALDQASLAGEFYYHLASSSFGNYVDQIGRYAAEGQTGWVFKVNGVSPPVGADQVVLKDGDRVVWYWAQFGVAGGPKTLRLVRGADRCYQVTAQDDAGVQTPAAGAVLTVGGKAVATNAFGHACLRKHTGLVYATLGGAVRSNRIA
jgi:hypothetical protein